MMSVAVAVMVHDDDSFLPSSIESFRTAGPVLAFVSRMPWHGEPGDWERAANIVAGAGAEVILGERVSELDHRRAVRATLLERGFTHALIPDGDEVIEPALQARIWKSLVTTAWAGFPDAGSVAFVGAYGPERFRAMAARLSA